MSETNFEASEIEKLGYDPKVIYFFQAQYPDLLSQMWGKSSDYFDGILSNKINNDLLWNAVGVWNEAQERGENWPRGNYYFAAEALLRYRGLI